MTVINHTVRPIWIAYAIAMGNFEASLTGYDNCHLYQKHNNSIKDANQKHTQRPNLNAEVKNTYCYLSTLA